MAINIRPDVPDPAPDEMIVRASDTPAQRVLPLILQTQTAYYGELLVAWRDHRPGVRAFIAATNDGQPLRERLIRDLVEALINDGKLVAAARTWTLAQIKAAVGV